MIARGDGNPGNASWGSDLSHLAISSIAKFIQEMRRKSLAYTIVGPLFRAQPSLDVLTACRRDNA